MRSAAATRFFTLPSAELQSFSFNQSALFEDASNAKVDQIEVAVSRQFDRMRPFGRIGDYAPFVIDYVSAVGWNAPARAMNQ